MEIMAQINIDIDEKRIEELIRKAIEEKIERLSRGLVNNILNTSHQHVIKLEQEVLILNKKIEEMEAKVFELKENCIVMNKVAEQLEELNKLKEEMVLLKLKLLNGKK
jgi:hypothetical protein